MVLPNFLVAGFPKCGSTSLYYYLREHPQIFLPKQKELHYFSFDIIKKLNTGRGDKQIKKFHIGDLKKYQSCFDSVTTEIAIGDVSPSYANYPEVIDKIKQTLHKDPKIVLILRDPIQRAYSNYLHLRRENRETLSFHEALLEEANRKEKLYSDFWYYQFNSHYYEKIKPLKDRFKDVYIITFEAFIEDRKKGIHDLYSFLGVDPSFEPQNLNTKFNEGGVFEQNPITKFIFSQNKLKTVVKKTVPITSGMKQLKLKAINRYKKSTPPIEPETEAYLVSRFKDEVHKLKEEFGVQTEYWNSGFQN